MAKSKSKRIHNGQPIKIFRAKRVKGVASYAIPFLLLAFFVIPVGWITNPDIQFNYQTLCIFVPSILFFSYIFIVMHRQKIVIYENGIEHHFGSRQSFVAWDEISHLEVRTIKNTPEGRYTTMREGLITHTIIKDDNEGGWIERFLRPFDDFDFLPLDIFAKIPSQGNTILLDEFRQTELGQIFEEYAPHVFDTNQS